jgi:hypothetical protein
MAICPKKEEGGTMSTDGALAAELEVVRELNRLFLKYLQQRAREGLPCLGLARELAAELRELAPAVLDRMANLPSALFCLDLAEATRARERVTPLHRPLEQMQLALVLTMLHSAWHMTRRRPFEARLFFKLSPATIRCLRATPLSEIHSLTDTPGIVKCAFPDGRLTWSAIMHRGDSEALRMMTLIALQPEVEEKPPFAAAKVETGIRSAG